MDTRNSGKTMAHPTGHVAGMEEPGGQLAPPSSQHAWLNSESVRTLEERTSSHQKETKAMLFAHNESF